jgi:hypothetical protein
MRVKLKFYLFLVYFVFFLIIFIGFVWQHESIHQRIFASYGIPSHVEYFSFKHWAYAETVPDMNSTQVEGLCGETCNSLHLQNEIAGYNIEVLLMALFLGFILLITLLERLIDIITYDIIDAKSPDDWGNLPPIDISPSEDVEWWNNYVNEQKSDYFPSSEGVETY